MKRDFFIVHVVEVCESMVDEMNSRRDAMWYDVNTTSIVLVTFDLAQVFFYEDNAITNTNIFSKPTVLSCVVGIRATIRQGIGLYENNTRECQYADFNH